LYDQNNKIDNVKRFQKRGLQFRNHPKVLVLNVNVVICPSNRFQLCVQHCQLTADGKRKLTTSIARRCSERLPAAVRQGLL
jgi:hypothetical protein